MSRDPEMSLRVISGTRVGAGGCMVWTRALTTSGYAKIKVKGRVRQGHRVAWEAANGPIPDGLVVDHICHTLACVNVDHLRLATRSENSMNRAGADSDSKSGVRNVYRTKGGRWRVCLKRGGVDYYLGTFDSMSEATSVAESGRKLLFGDFAGGGGPQV